MESKSDNNDFFSRRAFIIAAGQGVLLSVLAGRLAWLQIAESAKYKTLAEDNRINMRIIAPRRGYVHDRMGVLLAGSRQNFRLMITPEQTEDIAPVLDKVKKIITVDERDIKRVQKEAKKNPSYTSILVKANLTWDEVSVVEVNIPTLPGVSIEMGEIRDYPFGPMTAHLLGYVGAVNREEVDKQGDPVLKVPDFKIGKTGLEKAFEGHLRGQAGRVEYEVNVGGRQLREVNRREPIEGERLTLTIDSELQKFVYDRLSLERSAAAVIIDVHTGEIYAAASFPAFNPNDFTQGIEVNLWERLNNDRAYPLNNKVFGGQYPPGSTFKMMTAMAGLEAGAISPARTVFCPGYFYVGKKKFHCWKQGGHGNMNVKEAIAQSCDTFFYKISSEVGIDKIAETSRKFGLGTKFDTNMPEEKGGLIPDQAWKRKRFPKDKKWHAGETVVNAIGQGYMLTTPLQLAVMTARLVNGGKAVRPWMVAYENEKSVVHTLPSPVRVKKQSLDLVKEGMVRVLMPGGTAGASQIEEEIWQMGGKTGTSQVKAITASERASGSAYTQESLPWHLRHHALFVGFAPSGNPRYAAAVIVEHGIGGSKAAAPIARDILREAQRLDVFARKTTPHIKPIGAKA